EPPFRRRHVAVARAHAVPGTGHANANAVELLVGRTRGRVAQRVLLAQLLGDAGRRGTEIRRVVDHGGVAAAVVGDLTQRVGVDAAAQRPRVLLVDRDGVDERVAVAQPGPQLANRQVAGGI